MKRAVERHTAGEALVIPVILRPCDWHDTPFGKLLTAPRDGKAITAWPNLDGAFLDVTLSIKRAIKELGSSSTAADQAVRPTAPVASGHKIILNDAPRSSNLRMKKKFSEADVDEFLEGSFEFMASFL